MPSQKSVKTSKSVDEVTKYIRYISEREQKKAKGQSVEFQPFDLYFVGKVTKILGDARVEATNGAEGSRPFDVKIPGKFRGRSKKSNFISGGSFLLLVPDNSYTVPSYEMKAVIDQASVDYIHKITPLNESLIIVSSSDGKKDDGIDFDRSASKDEESDDDVDVDRV